MITHVCAYCCVDVQNLISQFNSTESVYNNNAVYITYYISVIRISIIAEIFASSEAFTARFQVEVF
jgi:hypothetical protein